MTKHYIIPIFVPHRGCPHDCIFCNQKKITGSIKEITALDVETTIGTYLETINKKELHSEVYIEVSFFGGSFTGIPMEQQNELLEVAMKAKEAGLVDAIRLSTRPDYIDKKILDNLLKHRVDVIELGVQSMDLEVLNKAERGHTSKEVIVAANLIKKYNFKLGLQMMVGLPLDNIEKDLDTAREIISLKPDFVRIYPALIIKDTELEALYKTDKYKPLDVYEAVEICKHLYIEFANNNIPIIRLGLQTTEQISMEGDVIGGPFHPAFRELVEGAILNDLLNFMLIKYFQEGDSIVIETHPRDISKVFADKKRFFQQTLNQNQSKKITIRQNVALDRFQLRFICGEQEENMSFYEYIKIVK